MGSRKIRYGETPKLCTTLRSLEPTELAIVASATTNVLLVLLTNIVRIGQWL